jgi:hypothetical protein
MHPSAAEAVREPRAVRLDPGDLEVETLVLEELENTSLAISEGPDCNINQGCYPNSCGNTECFWSCLFGPAPQQPEIAE